MYHINYLQVNTLLVTSAIYPARLRCSRVVWNLRSSSAILSTLLSLGHCKPCVFFFSIKTPLFRSKTIPMCAAPLAKSSRGMAFYGMYYALDINGLLTLLSSTPGFQVISSYWIMAPRSLYADSKWLPYPWLAYLISTVGNVSWYGNKHTTPRGRRCVSK